MESHAQEDDVVSVRIESDRLHIGWGEPSWFGPGSFTGPAITTIVEVAGDHSAILRLSTDDALGELATGAFDRPSVGWTFHPQLRVTGDSPDGAVGFGFQYTEFALPTRAGDDLAMWTLMPWRPAVVEPLLVCAPDGRCLLLGPLDAFHDQIISVPVPDALDRGIAWGWHGDLDAVPAGFATELAVVAGHGVRDTLDRYSRLVTGRHGTARPAVDLDALGRNLSYWTDNGAAYWYRTEGGRDTPTTLVDTVEDLRSREIPVDAVQLDSWFYPHEVLRPFDTDDWVVPPTGLIRWEPRADVLPDGIPALRGALGNPPLVTHCRHLSSASPLVDEFACWIDGDRAHPEGSDLYAHWLDRAVGWGVETFEHDWLIECFLGVRGLRERPGRAARWQQDLDALASERGVTLQWCMASPADILQTATLPRVTSVRTSGDHGYLVGPGYLWNWFLLVNGWARSLGLRPFKDVFWSDRSDEPRHAEVESLLAALSTGPVGIGDRLGRADRDLVLRTCRADGALVRPDVAIAAIDACYAADAVTRPVPLVAEAWTDHPAGRWSYLVALHAADNLPDQPHLDVSLDLTGLGGSAPAGPMVMWDWRRRVAELVGPDGSWPISLDHLDWDLRVLAPVLGDGLAVIGDPTRYAAAGTARLAGITSDGEVVGFGIEGDEPAEVVGWSRTGTAAARVRRNGDWSDAELTWSGDVWTLRLPGSDPGPAQVEIRPI